MVIELIQKLIIVRPHQNNFVFQLCFVLLHSRATVITWASIVRPSVDIRFLGNRQVD